MESLALLNRNDPQLIRQAGMVEDFSNPEFQTFIDQLIRCGEENEGVGIAAPQVGHSVRLFIMAPRSKDGSPNARYPDAPGMEPTALINPEILRRADTFEKGWEGCLSVPGFRGLVPRHTEIDVAYTTRFGERVEVHFAGFLARLFQHEFDHLEGILFPSRMEPQDPLVSLEEYKALTGIDVKR